MFDTLSFVPAKQGLEMNQRLGKGGTGAIPRAKELAKGAEVSGATVLRMAAYFSKHSDFEQMDERGAPTDAAVRHLMWGGEAARDWVNGVLKLRPVVGDHNALPNPKPTGEGITKAIDCKVAKVDDSLGIVFGYAIVCTEGGEPYYDTQGDNIPEEAMLEATADYMQGDRMAKVMHEGGKAGQVVYGFPITGDIAKALGITCYKTGFVVGMKPESDAILEKYRSGEFTGFSIGGTRIAETVVEA